MKFYGIQAMFGLPDGIEQDKEYTITFNRYNIPIIKVGSRDVTIANGDNGLPKLLWLDVDRKNIKNKDKSMPTIEIFDGREFVLTKHKWSMKRIDDNKFQYYISASFVVKEKE